MVYASRPKCWGGEIGRRAALRTRSERIESSSLSPSTSGGTRAVWNSSIFQKMERFYRPKKRSCRYQVSNTNTASACMSPSASREALHAFLTTTLHGFRNLRAQSDLNIHLATVPYMESCGNSLKRML